MTFVHFFRNKPCWINMSLTSSNRISFFSLLALIWVKNYEVKFQIKIFNIFLVNTIKQVVSDINYYNIQEHSHIKEHYRPFKPAACYHPSPSNQLPPDWHDIGWGIKMAHWSQMSQHLLCYYALNMIDNYGQYKWDGGIFWAICAVTLLCVLKPIHSVKTRPWFKKNDLTLRRHSVLNVLHLATPLSRTQRSAESLLRKCWITRLFWNWRLFFLIGFGFENTLPQKRHLWFDFHPGRKQLPFVRSVEAMINWMKTWNSVVCLQQWNFDLLHQNLNKSVWLLDGGRESFTQNASSRWRNAVKITSQRKETLFNWNYSFCHHLPILHIEFKVPVCMI